MSEALNDKQFTSCPFLANENHRNIRQLVLTFFAGKSALHKGLRDNQNLRAFLSL